MPARRNGRKTAPHTNNFINNNDKINGTKNNFEDLQQNAITLAGYCAVCWSKALYFCNFCKFVGYCCLSHMASHWCMHQPLCTVVNKQLQRNEGLLYGNKPENADQWRYFRVRLLERATQLMQRNVLSYERDLILFPKHCASCYETRTDKLLACKLCLQTWYCRSNPNHLPKNHREWCDKLQLFSSLVQKQAQGNLYMFDMNFGPMQIKSNIFNKNSNIKDVICEVLRQVCETINLDDCELAMIAQAASGPLTVLHAINIVKASTKKNFVIHLIGAELHYEGRTLQAWEHFFMHFLPEITNLKIVMVGPELNATRHEEKLQLCNDCKGKKKSCIFEYKDGFLYHEYIDRRKYPKPNLVCAFNPGLHRATGFNQCDTWPHTIRAALSNNCPFIFTAYTAYEAPLDLKRVQEHAKVVILQPPKLNPFASLKPDRNFISDHEAPLIFKNYYMSIVCPA